MDFTVESCWEAFKNNWLAPDLQENITLKLDDGTLKDCNVNNLHDQSISCPNGFIGKGDEAFCISINTDVVTNKEAVAKCYEDGSELLVPDNLEQDEYVNDVLATSRYSKPTFPGFYHVGLYQDQQQQKYYRSGGSRV